MLLTVEQAVATLTELGLVPEQEIRDLLTRLPVEQQPKDGCALLEVLSRRGRLTKYQADALRDRPPQPVLLSNYLLLELLGAGGMGRVFKALHQRMERYVALKVLHEKAIDSPDAIERFHREVKAAARLHHPNIVAAYDADEDHGMHFLVMEYVEGRDLAKLVEKGPLTLGKAVRHIAEAARALEYAHGEGVVHRDIKPANLLVNTKGSVKVLDMGIARIVATEAGQAATQLTHTGSILGTVDYLAPEQASDSNRADHRADIYSLGCTLYYILTGSPPHPGKNAIEKIFAHRDRDIQPLQQLRPDAPAELENLIRRMTARLPQNRIASMGEVAEILEALSEQCDSGDSTDYELASTMQVLAPTPALPQTATMQVSSETMAGSRTNSLEVLERFIDGCAGLDGYFDVDEEHAIFRKGGDLGIAVEDIRSVLDARCQAKGWTRHSCVTEELKKMLEELADTGGGIGHREFDRLIRHAITHKMPRRRAEEHCLTLMLDHQWSAKESFLNRWFTRRCQKYGLE